MNVLLTRSVTPPSNLSAELRNHAIVLTWDRADDSVMGYKVYRDSVLFGFVPAINPMLEFPFENRGIGVSSLMFAEYSKPEYVVENLQNGNHVFSVSAIYREGESSKETINIRYNRLFEFSDCKITPNPINVDRNFLIEVRIRDEANMIIE